MKEVKVRRTKLLEALRTNRTTHADEYERAVLGYRKEARAQFMAEVMKLDKGQPFTTNLMLDVPQNHTKDYDRVIKMLEMSTDDEIILSDKEFDQYVMDNWAWAAHTKFLNSGYALRAGLGD